MIAHLAEVHRGQLSGFKDMLKRNSVDADTNDDSFSSGDRSQYQFTLSILNTGMPYRKFGLESSQLRAELSRQGVSTVSS